MERAGVRLPLAHLINGRLLSTWPGEVLPVFTGATEPNFRECCFWSARLLRATTPHGFSVIYQLRPVFGGVSNLAGC